MNQQNFPHILRFILILQNELLEFSRNKNLLFIYFTSLLKFGDKLFDIDIGRLFYLFHYLLLILDKNFQILLSLLLKFIDIFWRLSMSLLNLILIGFLLHWLDYNWRNFGNQLLLLMVLIRFLLVLLLDYLQGVRNCFQAPFINFQVLLNLSYQSHQQPILQVQSSQGKFKLKDHLLHCKQNSI